MEWKEHSFLKNPRLGNVFNYLMLAICVSIAAVSCSKDNGNYDSNIVGTWNEYKVEYYKGGKVAETEDGEGLITFGSDGYYYYHNEADVKVMYSISGKQLTFWKVPVKILKLTDSEMVLEATSPILFEDFDYDKVLIYYLGVGGGGNTNVKETKSNTITYTSSDGQIVNPWVDGKLEDEYFGPPSIKQFGVTIISNTYENGAGKIVFDGDIRFLGGTAGISAGISSDDIPASYSGPFFACDNLTSITVPDRVTYVGYNTFNHCSSLTNVILGDSVTSIGSYAFNDCSSLTSINIPNSVTSIGDDAFSECSSLTSINIPNSVTSIGSYAFSYCASLTSINIPNNVTSIKDNTFYDCSSLTSINIPNGVTSIGDDAFSSCESLTSINIPNSVTSIGKRVFIECSSLMSINIPNSVTSIGLLAFGRCSNLTSITISSAKPCKLHYSAFEDTNNCPIYVPASAVEAYKSADGWKYYADRIKPKQ